MKRKVGIIDYGMGNLRSVFNAFSILECSPFISSFPEEIRQADLIVLPGVGAFGDGITNLRSKGWIDMLEEEVKHKGKPFLGICLGMQLLAATGTEHGLHKGLNWIPGVVERIKSDNFNLHVPHVGWNDVHFLKKDSLYVGLGNSQCFYFLHSYTFVPQDPNVASAIVIYGYTLAASVEADNIYATQFHPEKSHSAGITVLKNFLEVTSAS